MTEQQPPKPVVYVQDGKQISTHSMLKTFRRCPKQAEYKYVQRLKPRVLGKPLRRGTWIHALLEAHYKGEDWRGEHERQTKKFAKLFDEEKEQLGDLPRELRRLMKSYLWHYKNDPWKVLEVEFTLEAEFPDGTIYRGKIDALIENQYGLWIVDHKSHARLPNLDFRLLDAQSALYVWAAQQNGIPVQGHIWNYLVTKPPSVPEWLPKSNRMSARRITTDYPTYKAALKAYGLDPADYAAKLDYLKNQRYQPGRPQTSEFFRRDILEKPGPMLERVAQEAYHTSLRMHEYPWDFTEGVERVPDRSCTFSCSYTDLCTAELFGGNTAVILKNRYDVGDPMDYYYDDHRGDN